VARRWDVLGIGIATVDDLLTVEHYPPPDAKVAVEAHQRGAGGLTATALVAAARWGARCAYGGALGDDELSSFVRSALAGEGIDLSPSPHHPQAAPIHSTIIVDRTAHTRNIFFQRGAVVGPLPEAPDEAAVRAAAVLFVDHYGGGATARLQRLARAAGVPVVADLERADRPAFDEILALTDHLIVPRAFAQSLSGAHGPAEAVRALLAARAAVVVTCGAEGGWWATAEAPEPQPFRAFPVDVVDTTGCGDVFHGVYAAELAAGAGIERRLRHAAAAAALKARTPGAQRGIPRRAEVEAFLATRSTDAES
jgi:ribokinase